MDANPDTRKRNKIKTWSLQTPNLSQNSYTGIKWKLQNLNYNILERQSFTFAKIRKITSNAAICNILFNDSRVM